MTEAPVELLHKLSRSFIRHFPERGDNGASASAHCTSMQAEESFRDFTSTQSALAPGQDHQLDPAQVQAPEFEPRQHPVPKKLIVRTGISTRKSEPARHLG